MLLKSTCDLNREPIHDPDTLHSRLPLFCKQAQEHVSSMASAVGVRPAVQWAGPLVKWPLFRGPEAAQLHSFHFAAMFVLGAPADPCTFFLYECSVCLRLTKGVCLAMQCLIHPSLLTNSTRQ